MNTRTVLLPVKAAVVCILGLVLLLCPWPVDADDGTIVVMDLSDASNLGTTITSDTHDPASGDASIKVHTLWSTVVCLTEVKGFQAENCKLVYTAQVKSRDLLGKAYLEMWVYFPGDGPYFSRGLQSFVQGTEGWKTIETLFFLKAGQRPTEVVLNLVIQGKGTVWVDDVRLERQPLH